MYANYMKMKVNTVLDKNSALSTYIPQVKICVIFILAKKSTGGEIHRHSGEGWQGEESRIRTIPLV
jgi:hypothetical protein